jgi:hypothetical protein
VHWDLRFISTFNVSSLQIRILCNSFITAKTFLIFKELWRVTPLYCNVRQNTLKAHESKICHYGKSPDHVSTFMAQDFLPTDRPTFVLSVDLSAVMVMLRTPGSIPDHITRVLTDIKFATQLTCQLLTPAEYLHTTTSGVLTSILHPKL